MKNIFRHLRTKIFAGILVILPLGVTFLVLNFVFNTLNNILDPLIPHVTVYLFHRAFSIPGLGIIGFFLLLYKTRPGRAFRAIAEDPSGARLVGIPLLRTGLQSYALSGLLGGLIALLLAMLLGSASPSLSEQVAHKVLAVSIIAGLGAAVALPVVFNSAPSLRIGFAWTAVGVGILSALPFLLIAAKVRERPDFQSPSRLGIRESIRGVLRSRPFWLAMLVNWLAWLAIAIVEAVFAYYVVYWAGIPEEDSAIVLAIILGSAILFLPLVNWMAARLEKKWAFVVATLTWATTHVILWFVPQAEVVPIYLVGVLAGLGVSSAHILPTSMAADVMEALEVESGERQEGVFGGMMAFLQKLGTSVALLAIGWILELTGYQAGAATQNAATLTGLRVLVSWVPVVLLILASLCAAAFPITRHVHMALVARAALARAARVPEHQPAG